MSLTLSEPAKKKVKFYNLHISSLYNRKPPFPLVFGNERGRVLSDDVWFICTGRFNGMSVVIDDTEEMKNLHTMGFFGKGCLSKRVPNFNLLNKGPQILRERQWKRRKDWSKSAQNMEQNSEETDNPEPESKKQKIDGIVTIGNENLSLTNEILVICDSDTEDDTMLKLNPRIENEENQTVVESLHLCLEESFFLVYAIGCLQVIDLLGNLLPITTLWNMFCQTEENFIENYVAYHYFRAKGWIVKSGMQFGGQYILYKKGPIFYHSSYVVVVEIYNADGKRARNDLTVLKLNTLNRLAEASFKEILICEVHRPDVSEKELRHPNVLSKYSVRENLIRRWLPNQERESSNTPSTSSNDLSH